MKSCPVCNRTYPDDTLAFCLVDGSVLSAPYDPQRSPGTASRGNPTATQILKPTIPSEPAPDLPSTIRAPAPQVPPLYPGPRPQVEFEERTSSKVPWVIAGIAVLLASVCVVVLLVTRWSASRSETASRAPTSKSPTPERQTSLACGHTINSALYDKWSQMGGETGRLGCPITEETEAPTSPQGSTGRWIQFAKGDGGYLIEYTRPDGGPNIRPVPLAGQVFEVSGCMFKLYASLGGTKSWLGFPVEDGHEIPTGARQNFEAGYVLWDSKTYRCQAHKN